jgi:hypothetical protein
LARVVIGHGRRKLRALHDVIDADTATPPKALPAAATSGAGRGIEALGLRLSIESPEDDPRAA